MSLDAGFSDMKGTAEGDLRVSECGVPGDMASTPLASRPRADGRGKIRRKIT